jgi:hypothetical protein
MEWLGLLVWAMVIGLALPLAALGALTAPSLATVPLWAGAGLALTVVYLATDGGRWLAWAAAGAGLVGALAVAQGAAMLVTDDARTAGAGQAAEENAAGLAGAELPLLLCAAFIMILAAVGVTTVG